MSRTPTAEWDGRQRPVLKGTAGFLKKPAVGGGPTPPCPAKMQWAATWTELENRGTTNLGAGSLNNPKGIESISPALTRQRLSWE